MTTPALFLQRWLLALVVAVAALGLLAPAPARSLVHHHAISLALIVLVGAVGLALPVSSLRQARAHASRIAVTLVISSAVLPLLAWAASRVMPPGSLRLGILVAGVTPSEVASVALVAIAGGSTAIAAGMAIASTVVCVIYAGPVLHLLAGNTANFSTGSLLVSLTEIVLIPLTVGFLLRTRVTDPYLAQVEAFSSAVASLEVLILIWLVAGQVHVGVQYIRAGAAMLIFIGAASALAAMLTVRLPLSFRLSLGLPVAMRDFAIAAGIATQAFGAAAAAALGLYGVLVLLIGAGVARLGAVREAG